MNTTKTQHKLIAKLAIRSVDGLIAVELNKMPREALKGLETECEACALWCVENGCKRQEMTKDESSKFYCGNIIWRKPNGARY